MAQTLFNKGFKPLSQLSVLLGMLGISLIAGAVASFAVAYVAGMPLGAPEAMIQPKYAVPLRWMQVITTLFVFGLPPVLYAFICFRNGWQVLGFGKPVQLSLLLAVALLMVAASPLTEAMGILNKAIPLPDSWRSYFDGMEKNYESQVKAMLDVSSVKGLLVSIGLIALLPAVLEEIFFRGAMQGLLLRWTKSPWAAIGITAIIFSAIHLSWYGFMPRAMLGLLLGVVAYITGNIWYSIIMHFLNNMMAVIFMYLLQRQGKLDSISEMQVYPVWAGLLAAAAVAGILLWIVRTHRPAMPVEIMEDRSNPFSHANQPG